MGWLYGIPDVSFSNHFVYFYTLLGDENFNPQGANTYRGWSRKRQVGLQAQEEFHSNITELSQATTQINDAVAYVQQVAVSERQKELAAVRAYCKKMQLIFPFTADELDENYIMSHPEDFYLKLTTTLNKARLGAQQYKEELERIRANANGAKRQLKDYFKDDYRYRLYGDATSLLKKMIGTFRETERTENTWNQEVQEAVISITREMIQTRMVKGEDFAAIAVAVLVEIEKRLQKEMDTRRARGEEVADFVNLRGEIIETIKKQYLDELHNNDAQTATQRALLDIQSDDFLRVTHNVKSILGISTLEEDSKDYQRQVEDITQKAKQRSKNTRADRGAVARIQNLLGGAGRNLSSKLRRLALGKLDRRTAHGNLQELTLSLIEQNGYKAGTYAATDVLSIECNYDIKPNDTFINEILDSIGKEMSLVLEKERDKDRANEQDLRQAIMRMNQSIDKSIRKLDQKLKELNQNDIGEFFVFHESLKLYSSMETEVYKKWGGHAGFGGREMNILSYIDYMMTGLEAAGLSTPLDRDTLVFLALNLSRSAIGEGYNEPLKKYFSIFAGLLMFDDVVNMTKEAIDKEMQKTSVQQVHLYNLNGVYVPASMVLAYVGDALSVGASAATYSASVSINSGEAAKAIDKWEVKYGQIKSVNPHVMLGPKDWQEMGAKVATGTKVKIAFMGAFLQFINKLGDLN